MIKNVLNIARWAPSGDNCQPWRFEILSQTKALIHGFTPVEVAEYDSGNYSYSHFAHGCLLKTIELAASGLGLEALLRVSDQSTSAHPIYEVELQKSNSEPDPLSHYLLKRVSNRFFYKTTAVPIQVKRVLEESVKPDFSLIWLEGFSKKRAFASLNYDFARFAKPQLAGIIEWNAQFSKDHLPDEALGLDSMNLRIVRFLFSNKQRLEFARNYLGADVISALTGFYIPSLLCGAHVAIIQEKPPQNYIDFTETGKAFQKFWLQVAQLGLSMQMETGPIAFSRIVWDGLTKDPTAVRMAHKLEKLLGEENAKKTVMLVRIGYGKEPQGRSVRLSLDELEYKPEQTNVNIWKKVE